MKLRTSLKSPSLNIYLASMRAEFSAIKLNISGSGDEGGVGSGIEISCLKKMGSNLNKLEIVGS